MWVTLCKLYLSQITKAAKFSEKLGILDMTVLNQNQMLFMQETKTVKKRGKNSKILKNKDLFRAYKT